MVYFYKDIFILSKKTDRELSSSLDPDALRTIFGNYSVIKFCDNRRGCISRLKWSLNFPNVITEMRFITSLVSGKSVKHFAKKAQRAKGNSGKKHFKQQTNTPFCSLCFRRSSENAKVIKTRTLRLFRRKRPC